MVILSENEGGYRCSECEFQTKYKESLKRHLWGVHDIGVGKIYRCSECNYQTKNKWSLKKHLWSVHDIGVGKIYQCSECNYQTKQKGNLKTHLWLVHDIGVGKIYQCSECNYQTKLKGHLKTHLWLVHDIGVGKIYRCSECNYQTKDKGNLKKHIMDKHKFDYRCPHCSAIISHLQHFKSHISTPSCYSLPGYVVRRHETAKKYIVEYAQKVWAGLKIETEVETIDKTRLDVVVTCRDGFRLGIDHTLHKSKYGLIKSIMAKFEKNYHFAVDQVFIIVFCDLPDILEIIHSIQLPENDFYRVLHWSEILQEDARLTQIFKNLELCHLGNACHELHSDQSRFFQKVQRARDDLKELKENFEEMCVKYRIPKKV